MLSRIILILLIATSATLFWRRFGVIARRILSARKDPDFALDSIGRRSWQFFSEVICQSKVIRERPLPGLAHAFVFWGFLAFALVTLNHISTGLGLPLFHRETGFGFLYYWLAFVFAASVAVSIAGLAFRRLVLRPKWLGKVSYESGFIALLIFTLMVTYMAEWWVADASFTGKLLWWLHTAALLVFLPLVPHTKHLHLILSPLTIFLKRERFSQIPPLAGDEDFGFINGKDITRIAALQVYSCVECGRCTEHCPANATGKELDPKKIALGMRTYLNVFGTASEEPIFNAAYKTMPKATSSSSPRPPPSSAPPAGPANINARSASSTCPSSSVCAGARSTPAPGKTPMEPSSSSISNAPATRWALPRPSVTNSSRRKSCPSSTALRNTVFG